MPTVWTLLITDDSQEDREIYRAYLSEDPDQSYRFIEAGSAEAGLELCQTQHCDAILLDFSLPDMTGLEFLEQLKQTSRSPLPVIMLTGQGNERVAVQAMRQGAYEYLSKQDLAPDVLQHTVRHVLEQAYTSHPISQPPLATEVALHLHQTLDAEQILRTAAIEVRQLLECDRILIYQVSQPIAAASDLDPAPLNFHKRFDTSSNPDTSIPLRKIASVFERVYAANLPPNQAALSRDNHATILASSGKEGKDTYLLAPIVPPQSPTAIWGLMVACQDATHRQWQLDETLFLSDLAGQLAVALQRSEQFKQFSDLLAREQQQNLIRGQLVNTVSYNYRAPLASILAAASTLKQHGDSLSAEKTHRFLSLIETKARDLTQRVEDLLLLNAFENGQTKFERVPVKLLPFISDIVDEQQQATQDSHDITCKKTGNTRGFCSDLRLLRLIVLNLLTNAQQQAPEGSEIEVLVSGTPMHVAIQVKCDVLDMPNAEATLDLTMVKLCAQLHEGKVTCYQPEAEQTQWVVWLPKQ
jgi:CheY-like chemotaxis protein/GAF domain-containing protein